MSEKKRGPRKKFKKFDKPIKEIPIESNEYISFIVGYTSGGAAYGLTWEQYDPYLEENKEIKNDNNKGIKEEK